MGDLFQGKREAIQTNLTLLSAGQPGGPEPEPSTQRMPSIPAPPPETERTAPISERIPSSERTLVIPRPSRPALTTFRDERTTVLPVVSPWAYSVAAPTRASSVPPPPVSSAAPPPPRLPTRWPLFACAFAACFAAGLAVTYSPLGVHGALHHAIERAQSMR